MPNSRPVLQHMCSLWGVAPVAVLCPRPPAELSDKGRCGCLFYYLSIFYIVFFTGIAPEPYKVDYFGDSVHKKYRSNYYP